LNIAKVKAIEDAPKSNGHAGGETDDVTMVDDEDGEEGWIGLEESE
jgi:hypothetical protein